MFNKVVIIGSNGLVGTELMKAFPSAIGLTHSDIEIENFENVKISINNLKPDLIINTAGLNNTDECEKDQVRAFLLNALSLRNIAMISEHLGIPLVQFSTDYVFGGEKDRKIPYNEDDLPRPVNVCGISKLSGEYFVRSYCRRHYIIRISAVYGPTGSRAKGGRDFVKTMIAISKEKKEAKVVNDQFVSPTCAIDLANKVRELVETKQYGIYHIAGSGVCSWFEFADAIFKIRKIDIINKPIITDKDYNVQRAYYTGLNNRKIKEIGLKNIDNWKICLERYLKIYDK